MAKCLRCGAGNEWLQGNVKPPEDQAEIARLREENERLQPCSECWARFHPAIYNDDDDNIEQCPIFGSRCPHSQAKIAYRALQAEIARLREENERLEKDNTWFKEKSEACVSEHIAVSGRVTVLEAELKAKQTELEAWFSVFGTQQLSHASTRLEAAESKVQRLETENERLKVELNEWKTKTYSKDDVAWMAARQKITALEAELAEREKRLIELETWKANYEQSSVKAALAPEAK